MLTGTYPSTLPDGRQLLLALSSEQLEVFVSGDCLARLQITAQVSGRLDLSVLSIVDDALQAATVLGVLGCGLFDTAGELAELAWAVPEQSALGRSLLQHGWAVLEPGGLALLSTRTLLRQIPAFGLPHPHPLMPLNYVMTDGKRHPLRAPYPQGVVYRRYVAALGQHVVFKTVEPDADVEIFSRWQNQPRVAAFWELAGSLPEHRAYLCKVAADAHIHPVLGYFDEQPFGYFELYWAKEDRIAPFYPVDDYDRGLHLLVGEECLRGPHRVAAWLPSLAHYLFLADPRTRSVVAEPRADNAKIIAYMTQAGFYQSHEFDFPHKRAAMMRLSREAFFGQFCV